MSTTEKSREVLDNDTNKTEMIHLVCPVCDGLIALCGARLIGIETSEPAECVVCVELSNDYICNVCGG